MQTSPFASMSSRVLRKLAIAGMSFALSSCGGGGGSGSTPNPPVVPVPPIAPAALQRILFVGDSFTHGRYAPVRSYNAGGTQDAATGSSRVVDENYGQTGARAELEPGPWGGIPGIFAALAVEASLNYDVHIEAISATSLDKNFAAAASVIEQSKWNAVVLQELSPKPLTFALTGSTTSDPSAFCSSVKAIEQGVHGVAASANVYLYETWPRADLAQALSGAVGSTGYHDRYVANLAVLGNANHNAYDSAASHDGAIAGVAPVGDAWERAWSEGIANLDPSAASTLPLLWYNIETVNNPAISAPDLLHPSIYGAYLSGLVLFQQVTGSDVRSFGASESAAQALGIPAATAVQLQRVAWEAVTQESAAPIDQAVDPCTLTQ